MTGAGGDRQPLSAIHPDAVAMARNQMIAGALSEITRPVEERQGQQEKTSPQKKKA